MAVLSAAEVQEQAESVYVRGTYYIALVNSASAYNARTTYATVQADEVTAGTGGYARLSYSYTSDDLVTYTTGQPLAAKVATWVHDGTSGDIVFNKVVLLREVSGTYTVVGFQELEDAITLTGSGTARVTINLLHGT